MGIQREIWLPAIEGNFYSEWEILSRLGKDDSIYVDNKTVHIPNAGSVGTLLKNNTSYPVGVGSRTDTVNDYTIDSYQMPPVRIGNFDQSQLSYDKTLSVIQDQTGNLGEYIKFDIFTDWYIGKVAGKYVETSGSVSGVTVTSEAPGSTASVLTLTLNDVKKARRMLDKQKVPVTGRILLLPPAMFDSLHSEVITNFTINDNDGMLMFDKPLFGFEVVMQPEVLNVTSAGTARAYMGTSGSTDLQVGYAYQKDQVSFAKSGIELFETEKDSAYYGDIISAEAWAAGKYRRYDKQGIIPIIEKVNS